MRRLHLTAVVAAALVIVAAVALATPGASAQDPNPTGSYIVVLHDEVRDPGAVADEHSRAEQAQVSFVYRRALKGYAARMSPQAAGRIADDPRVAYVDADGIATTTEVQPGATWGLDRIDQRALPLDGTYTYNTTAGDVWAYVIDTGIRASHSEFGGRVKPGYTAINDRYGTSDCNGHGTHVAGTVGGTTYGVAKAVNLVPVRVLNCQGSGTWSGVIAGIDWVTGQKTTNPDRPMVANMSLGGGYSQSVNDAVTRSSDAGVTYAVSAGNDSGDACAKSPASTPAAITVGATNSSDAKASWSNWGTCVDLFAPGVSITSAWHTSNTATNTISGTSMASPHVAGVAALHLAGTPKASASEVSLAITSSATMDAVTGAGTDSPNLLLYSLLGASLPADTTEPTVSITSPANGATVSGPVTITADASDNVGVTKVEFRVGGAVIAEDTSEPYSATWDSTTVVEGSYVISAKAYDAAGNHSTSAGITVTVSNPPASGVALSGTSQNNGSTWTAIATVSGLPAGATASGTWSTSATSSCTASGAGTCSMSLPGIPKRTGSVTFTLTEPSLSPQPSVTISKP
jgi:subtilisin family serine protease